MKLSSVLAIPCLQWDGVNTHECFLEPEKWHTLFVSKSDKQYVDVIRVLNKLPGMWHGRGTPEAPVLLVLDSHYDALVKAGVIPVNGKEVKARGKKTAGKKVKS